MYKRQYIDRAKDLIKVWHEFYKNGYDVPKIAFYTNSNSPQVVQELFSNLYDSAFMQSYYENLDDLWYKIDGKPLIIANNTSSLPKNIKDYFHFRESQWPNEARKENGFPWMEFDRLFTKGAIYGAEGAKKVMNVSIAQHCATIRFSATAWYGGNDRTRNWHNGKNDMSEDAYLYGYNFAEQWEFALKNDPDIIFITGWNEWVAQRQGAAVSQPIVFVDCADLVTSRDAEPMRGGYGDNYYLQMIDYIRKYKGTDSRVYIGDNKTIDINGSFEQWDSPDITAVYKDYSNDTEERFEAGFGSEYYINSTGRNDIVNVKTARDTENLYFYADTSEAITGTDTDNCMNLFIDSGAENPGDWYGYDYMVSMSGGKAVLNSCGGGWAWTEVGEIEMKIEDNKIMYKIPRSMLNIPDSEDCVLDIQFKWADNYQLDENNKGDIWSFYEDGDAAPYGRMNYVFSEKIY